MNVEREELARTERIEVRYRDGPYYLHVTYVFHAAIPCWTMTLCQDAGLWDYQAPLIEAAVRELKRLNGTLPPVRIGGLRPAKGGEK